jgi:hypothetical protein
MVPPLLVPKPLDRRLETLMFNHRLGAKPAKHVLPKKG